MNSIETNDTTINNYNQNNSSSIYDNVSYMNFDSSWDIINFISEIAPLVSGNFNSFLNL
jgi:hypothetical protein